jgi:glycine cleavage system aminomethyltransferase T
MSNDPPNTSPCEVDSSKYFRASMHRLLRSPFYSCYAGPEVVLGISNHRLYPWTIGDDPVEVYWHLRKQSVLYDVPETPLEIQGPDAAKLLNRVLTRDVAKLKVGRAAYGLACLPDGGILMDGVVMRLADDKYWYIQADGEFFYWLKAHAEGLDVSVRDPNCWAIQIQGPTSLEVLRDVCDGGGPEGLRYFGVAECTVAGQPLLVSRSGWTGELGFEFYTTDENVDGPAIWERLLAVGKPHGLIASGLESMGIRRIEAGILDYGTDIDCHMTPFHIRMGNFVDFKKEDFIGKAALEQADRGPALHGFLCPEGAAQRGSQVFSQGKAVGRVTSAAWSPYLKAGIGYWRSEQPGDWHGEPLSIATDGDTPLNATSAEYPFYDVKKEIPRGLATME